MFSNRGRLDAGEGEQEGGPASQHPVPGALTGPRSALTLYCEFSTGHQWIPSRVSGKTRSTRVFPGAPTLTHPHGAARCVQLVHLSHAARLLHDPAQQGVRLVESLCRC